VTPAVAHYNRIRERGNDIDPRVVRPAAKADSTGQGRIYRSRMDYDKKLGDAFKELFSVTRADKEAAALRRTPDGGIEFGLSDSAPVA